ncbi:MAG: leucyl aminopeptidase [Planctomycetes bacterium]|nr:leucyl aminopeptidase [Planctomycetota bacterium]
MKIESFSADWVQTPCDALVIAADEDWRSRQEIQQLSAATDGWLSRLLESGEISTKPNKVTVLLGPPKIATPLLAIVGTGSRTSGLQNIHFRASSAAMKAICTRKRGTVRLVGLGASPLELRAAVAGAMVGCVGQDLFRAEKSLVEPDRIEWVGVSDPQLRAGQTIGESINLTRRLVNLPPNYLYPETFEKEARAVAADCGITIEVWDKSKLEQERCGALLGVARGSVRDPRLIILRYQGSSPDAEPLALVGKGVTFDSGGYSIKPTDGMLTMKCDMAGAATVLGILNAAAKLRAKRNIVGVLGLVENLVSGDAFKLGDVLTARSGKTIEIHNTDAEGRLVLADCLSVALDQKPSQIVDFATLTGACVVALGTEVAGLMTNNSKLQSEIQSFSERCGEHTWPLPMHSFFTEQIAGKVADIKNVGEGRWGGAITAAKFLEEFVADTPWAHLDIAGPAFYDSPKPWADAGGSGVLVRSFAEWLLA